jgi:hypothetical protein
MSDFSDTDTDDTTDTNKIDKFDDEFGDDDIIERLFDLSIRLQSYCRERGLPIFNECQTTAILLDMFYK